MKTMYCISKFGDLKFFWSTEELSSLWSEEIILLLKLNKTFRCVLVAKEVKVDALWTATSPVCVHHSLYCISKCPWKSTFKNPVDYLKKCIVTKLNAGLFFITERLTYCKYMVFTGQRCWANDTTFLTWFVSIVSSFKWTHSTFAYKVDAINIS